MKTTNIYGEFTKFVVVEVWNLYQKYNELKIVKSKICDLITLSLDIFSFNANIQKSVVVLTASVYYLCILEIKSMFMLYWIFAKSRMKNIVFLEMVRLLDVGWTDGEAFLDIVRFHLRIYTHNKGMQWSRQHCYLIIYHLYFCMTSLSYSFSFSV